MISLILEEKYFFNEQMNSVEINPKTPPPPEQAQEGDNGDDAEHGHKLHCLHEWQMSGKTFFDNICFKYFHQVNISM